MTNEEAIKCIEDVVETAMRSITKGITTARPAVRR